MPSTIRAILFAAVVALLSACGAQPILSFRGAAIPASARGEYPSAAAVHDAMLRALAMRGWVLDEDRLATSQIYASVSAGGHGAQVLISYYPTHYSIEHSASTPGLRFDGTHIHKRYNHWISALNEAIQSELGRLPPASAQPVAPAPVAPVPVQVAPAPVPVPITPAPVVQPVAPAPPPPAQPAPATP